MNQLHPKIAIGLVLAMFMISCEKSCSKKPTSLTPEKSPEEVHDNKENLATSLSHLDVSGLSETQLKSLTKLFNDEICPCGCPKTFAQCLNMAGCKAGSLLAQWTADQLKEGAPEHYLFKAISEEINAGFLVEAKPVTTLDAHQKGNKNARIKIVEFADFECPGCKMAAREMKEFLQGRDDVQLYFMHFPLSVHPNAQAAAVAAEAAGKQGKFWELHDLMFAHQGPLSPDTIRDMAKTLFTDPKQLAQFDKDLMNPALAEKVKAHKEYGQHQLKLMSTPTFLWNGRPYNLSSSKEGYLLRLNMEKAREDIRCQ